MAAIKRFEELHSWQKSRELCDLIFKKIIRNEKVRDFELINQINRSSGSIMDNIAEGFERNGNKEFRQFLSIAKASCAEVKSQLYRANDRNYLTAEEFEETFKISEEISKLIAGLMNYIKQSDMKCSKYNSSEEQTLNQ